MKKEISRRNFIKGTAALTAGAALLAVTGCAEGAAPQPQEAPKPKHVKAAVFSPTEGTKNAAAMLAAKFSDDVEFADLTNASSRTSEVTFTAEDLAIVAAPSYGGQIPMVEGLFTNLKGDNTPCVIVCAFGNRAAENVYANIAKIVSAQGFVVVGAIGLVTPHVFSSNAKAGHSRPNVDDNKIMAEFAGKVMDKLNSGKIEALTLEGTPDIDWAKEISVAPKEFKAENCVQCGACASSCTTGAIDPQTLEIDEAKCVNCQRCSFVCEFNARSYDTAVKRDFIEGKLSTKKPVEYFV